MPSYPDVWIFDENRRIYRKDKGGRPTGGPIWREHWRKLDIVGETRVSWVSSFGKKIPKKGGRGICFSLEEINQQAFVKGNIHKIVDAVRQCNDYATVRAIAELVGYENTK